MKEGRSRDRPFLFRSGSARSFYSGDAANLSAQAPLLGAFAFCIISSSNGRIASAQIW